jgi:hypothetical protein
MSKKLATAAASSPASPEDEHKAAKAAFEEAVAKTKAQQGISTEPEKEHEETAEKPKGKVSAEGEETLRAIREELAELRSAMSARSSPQKEEEPEDEDLEEIRAELAERFGDEEGGVLAKALQRISKAKDSRIEKLEKFLDEGMKRSREQIDRSNRSRLAEKYPQLAEDEAWEMLSAGAAAALQQPGSKFVSADEAYEAKAKALYGAPRSGTQPSKEDIEEASRIAASQPSQPGRAPRERKLTGMEAHRAVFDHLRKGGSVGDALKLARQAAKHQKEE